MEHQQLLKIVSIYSLSSFNSEFALNLFSKISLGISTLNLQELKSIILL